MDQKNNQMVRKGNQLIEAKYKLSLHQQRVIYALLETISPYDEDFKVYRLDISAIAEKYGLQKSNSLYLEIQNSLAELVTTKLAIHHEDHRLILAWLSSAEYRIGGGYSEICFDPKLKPFLLLLKGHYTEYPIAAVAGFKSSYSFRFYEWLQMMRYKGNGGKFYRIFTIDEIKEKMQIGKKEYPFFKDLRVRIIEPAMQEIEKHSDLHIVSVEYIKTSKAITSIKITAEPKKKNIPIIQILEEQIPKVYDDLINAGISEETAKKWVKKYPSKRIETNLAYTIAMKRTTEIKNLPAYLATAIADDVANGWEDKAQKQRKAALEQEQEKRKKAEAEELKHKKEREEDKKATAIFESQSEQIQNSLLDHAESLLKDNELILNEFRKKRRKGTAHTHPLTLYYIKISIKDMQLI